MKWKGLSYYSEHYSGGITLFEPHDIGLPERLLASLSLVRVVQDIVHVPISNVGITNVLLYPCMSLGTMGSVDMVSLPAGVIEVTSDVAMVHSQVSQIVSSTVQEQIDAIDLSICLPTF